MAASGIAEHNEARRRQQRADRMAYIQTDYIKVSKQKRCRENLHDP